jgi:hypothetical protein
VAAASSDAATYHIADQGGIYNYDEMLALVRQWGGDPLAELGDKSNRGIYPLPFVYLFGRADFLPKLKSLSSCTVFCSSIARLWIESTPRPKWNPRRSSSVRSMRSELRQVTGILRYELTDYKWAAVGPLLPTRPDGVARMR